MWPAEAQPTDHLAITHGEAHYRLPCCRIQFTAATEVEGVHTFGGKDLLLVDGRPQFAEVAILRLFQAAVGRAAGWRPILIESTPGSGWNGNRVGVRPKSTYPFKKRG